MCICFDTTSVVKCLNKNCIVCCECRTKNRGLKLQWSWGSPLTWFLIRFHSSTASHQCGLTLSIQPSRLRFETSFRIRIRNGFPQIGLRGGISLHPQPRSDLMWAEGQAPLRGCWIHSSSGCWKRLDEADDFTDYAPGNISDFWLHFSLFHPKSEIWVPTNESENSCSKWSETDRIKCPEQHLSLF